MKVESTEFEDVKIIEGISSGDSRGKFTKIFNEDFYSEFKLNMNVCETYYSVSNKNVIRGMHFQLPPYEHEKLVHVIQGSVIDVILDLRKDSMNYKKSIGIFLSADKPYSIYIPKGFAHGFKSLEDNTIMLYQVTSVYSPEHDTGIAYDTIGFDWGVENPIVSGRDQTFISLDNFKSPF